MLVFQAIGLTHYINIPTISQPAMTLRSIMQSDYSLMVASDNGDLMCYKFNGTEFEHQYTRTEMGIFVRYLALNEKYEILFAAE